MFQTLSLCMCCSSHISLCMTVIAYLILGIRSVTVHVTRCPKHTDDINPQHTLDKTHNKHLPLIQFLRTRSLRGISPNNKIALYVMLLGVGGTIYNQYTITPLLNLGIPLHKVHQLATALHCHAIKSLNKTTKTRHKKKSSTTTLIIGVLMGGYWLSGWLQEG